MVELIEFSPFLGITELDRHKLGMTLLELSDDPGDRGELSFKGGDLLRLGPRDHRTGDRLGLRLGDHLDFLASVVIVPVA